MLHNTLDFRHGVAPCRIEERSFGVLVGVGDAGNGPDLAVGDLSIGQGGGEAGTPLELRRHSKLVLGRWIGHAAVLYQPRHAREVTVDRPPSATVEHGQLAQPFRFASIEPPPAFDQRRACRFHTTSHVGWTLEAVKARSRRRYAQRTDVRSYHAEHPTCSEKPISHKGF